MKKPMAKKVLAAISAAAVCMSAVACSSNDTTTAEAPKAEETKTEEAAPATEETTEEVVEEVVEEEVSPYTVLTDANGNPYDLGGMEIVIRDWWSSGGVAEPTNDYEEARQEWRDWIQETYNFKIKELAISDWGSCPQDFVDYVTTGGDDNNYIFVLRGDPAITSGMANGLMYDLSTIDCLDFSQPMFQSNKVHEMYSKGNAIYAMNAGPGEPRTGVYFNKRVLTDAGIDPNSIYEMQANGTWTWDAFANLMEQVHRDTDNDGVIDVYGLTLNEGVMTRAAVFSNGGSYVGKNADGYYYNLEAPETLEALEWTVDMFTKYDQHDPEDAAWDYYKEEFINGTVGFMVEDEYAATPGNFLQDMQDEIGFVMFPIGPKMSTYVNVWSDNPKAIPACYDAQKAWNIAFAWMLYCTDPAGYEGYNGFPSTAAAGKFDMEAVEQTVPMMSEAAHGTIAFHDLIPNMNVGPDLEWNIGPNAVVSEAVEAIRETWKSYIDDANK